ncbi:MAG: mechanosensitive ion channel [Saprospiraceae bacterium]|nr:mechanosensitive ion channel [Saprospiraceae bacterium]
MNFSYFTHFLPQVAMMYLPKIAMALLTLLIGLWVIGWVTRIMDNGMQKRGLDNTIRPFLSSLMSVGLKVMLLLSVASMFGIETTSFIAIFTALAFAVGTALSGSLGHFASGVLLLIFRPYKVGDLVSIGGGQTGKVSEIQVFNTILLTTDNKKIIIPNGVVTSNIMTNISGQGQIRVDMLFHVAETEDIDKVRACIQKVADESSLVLKTPPVDIYVNNLPTGSIEFLVRPWCNSDDYWDAYFYMKEGIKRSFNKEGIETPKSGLEVYLNK